MTHVSTLWVMCMLSDTAWAVFEGSSFVLLSYLPLMALVDTARWLRGDRGEWGVCDDACRLAPVVLNSILLLTIPVWAASLAGATVLPLVGL